MASACTQSASVFSECRCDCGHLYPRRPAWHVPQQPWGKVRSAQDDDGLALLQLDRRPHQARQILNSTASASQAHLMRSSRTFAGQAYLILSSSASASARSSLSPSPASLALLPIVMLLSLRALIRRPLPHWQRSGQHLQRLQDGGQSCRRLQHM